MPKIQWTLPSDDDETDVESEWENLKKGEDPPPKEPDYAHFENLVVEEVTIDDSDKGLAEFLSSLPEETQEIMRTILKSGKGDGVLGFTKQILRVTELLSKMDYRDSVQSELAGVLKRSASDPDGFRGYVRSVIALIEDRLKYVFPYGVKKVPGPSMSPPSGQTPLEYITSTQDVERRIDAYWEDYSHSIITMDSNGDTACAPVFDIFERVLVSFLREMVGESMLRVAVHSGVGSAKGYEHMIRGLDEIRAEYLRGLHFIYENWESPGVEAEARAVVKAASHMHPVEYNEAGSQVVSPWVYLGTYRTESGDLDLTFNLANTTFCVGGNATMGPLEVAKAHLQTEDPARSSAMYVALAMAHSVGVLSDSPTTWLRRAESD